MPDQFFGAELGADVPEVDLHGMSKEEAGEALERHLQGAFMRSLGIVRIIHGQGTGVLKTMVMEVLKSHPNVKSFRIGEGASYAEIEKR